MFSSGPQRSRRHAASRWAGQAPRPADLTASVPRIDQTALLFGRYEHLSQVELKPVPCGQPAEDFGSVVAPVVLTVGERPQREPRPEGFASRLMLQGRVVILDEGGGSTRFVERKQPLHERGPADAPDTGAECEGDGFGGSVEPRDGMRRDGVQALLNTPRN